MFLDILPNFSKLFLYFGVDLPNDGTNELSKGGFDGIALKVIFKGRKGQIGPFFTYLSILFSSTEVLPNCIVPCSFIGVMSILS